MEGSTVANSQVFPTDRTASVVHDVVRETERRRKLIANRSVWLSWYCVRDRRDRGRGKIILNQGGSGICTHLRHHY